jgi:hypothetical protein
MFKSNLTVTQVGVWEKRTVWQLKEGLYANILSGVISFGVPIYFFTDFASVPRHFGLYELYGGRGNKEAAAHDYLYRKGSSVSVYAKSVLNCDSEDLKKWISEILKGSISATIANPPKPIADLIFRQLMIEEGESCELYDPMYEAVKVGGASSYHQYDVADRLPCDKWDVVGNKN